MVNGLQDGLRNGKGRRIRAVLKWLRNCKSGDIVSKEINQNLPPKKIDQVKWCLDYYQNLPDTGECQSVLKGTVRVISLKCFQCFLFLSCRVLRLSLFCKVSTLTCFFPFDVCFD